MLLARVFVLGSSEKAISKSQIIPTRLLSRAATVKRGVLVSMVADKTSNGHEMREMGAKETSDISVGDAD
jgi:hypothetical protein